MGGCEGTLRQWWNKMVEKGGETLHELNCVISHGASIKNN